MNAEIIPGYLNGKIAAIPSKSDVHRILIACALADKQTEVNISSLSDDMYATIRCLTALGAKFEINQTAVTVYPIQNTDKAVLDCGESGSTLRFLMPVAASVCSDNTFSGHGRLPERPIDDLRNEMEKNGCTFSPRGEFPIHIKGNLKSGIYTLPGNVSSQYITGLLFALPILNGDSRIDITSALQSKAYVDMTLTTLKKFGIEIYEENNSYIIKGSQKYRSPGIITADGDWSNATFWLCAGAIGGNITVTGLSLNSIQGDKYVLDILKQMNASIHISDNSITVTSKGTLHAVDIDAEQIPDLVPILSVTALAAQGKTRIYNAKRLRLKECDRLDAVSRNITNLGGSITEGRDFLEINGGTRLNGGTVDSFNDHRMAMSEAICAALCDNKIIITNAQAVNKSYPTFFDDYKYLGGNVDVIDNGQ